MTKQKNTLEKIEFHITLCFTIFIVSAFIGWAYETIITSIVCEEFTDRGVLHIPLCPIYGFGAILLLFLFHKIRNMFLIFLLSASSTTLIELLASYLLEFVFHTQLWSYRGWPFQFQERISLMSSLLFGLFGIFLMKVVYPVTQKLMVKLKPSCRILVSVIVLIILLTDTITIIDFYVR